MATSSSDSSVSTFVLRFWREWSAGRPRWRGQIDHVQSGTSAWFLDLEEMGDILHGFGVMVTTAAQPGDVTTYAETEGWAEGEAAAHNDPARHEKNPAV